MTKEHRFWNTQPARIGTSNTIIHHPTVIQQTEYPLPNGLVFTSVSVDEIDAIYDLLKRNYVEDPEHRFRLVYSKKFLLWQFMQPAILVGVKQGDKLVGFALGREHTICLNYRFSRALSVNFLCVDRHLRNRHIAPIIIQEMTRRANLKGVFQAVFTAGIELPFKFTCAQYFHFVINQAKVSALYNCRSDSDDLTLVGDHENLLDNPEEDSNCSLKNKRSTIESPSLGKDSQACVLSTNPETMSNNLLSSDGNKHDRPCTKNTTLSQYVSYYEDNVFTLLHSRDIKEAMDVLNADYENYVFHEVFDRDSAKFNLLPLKDVKYTLICKKNEVITGLITFVIIQTYSLENDVYMKGAYLYHIAGSEKAILVQKAIEFCKSMKIDMFNILNIASNFEFIGHLKFQPGDGKLNYYLFNWESLPIAPHQTSFFLP